MVKLNLDLYKKLFLIRHAEEQICVYYPEDEMKTPMHMSMGEEALVVGVCHALSAKDQIFSTYRSHAAFLSKAQDSDYFFAEMYSKDSSLLKGKGGSMHLCSPEHGFMGSSAIVASHIPVAIGAAFANKIQKNNRLVAVFFGDGAVDEGGFWESLNIASLMRLPVIFVCEDNALAVHTPSAKRRGYSSLTSIVSKFDFLVAQSESTDAEVIYRLTENVITKMRQKKRPAFLDLKYYRYLEHVGINYDFDAGYRSENEFKKWQRKDPVLLQRRKLRKMNVKEAELKVLEEEIQKKVKRSIALAKKAPFCDKGVLYAEIFR